MSPFPPQVLKTVALYHVPTTGGQTQPYPGSPDVTVLGAFLPLDTKQHVIEGENLVDPHEIYLEQGTDVRVGDKCVIDATTYYVKKVFNAYFGGLTHKRCTISTES